jgi:hypothetical protein
VISDAVDRRTRIAADILDGMTAPRPEERVTPRR